MLFWRSYIRVQCYHRVHSNHHLEYEYQDKIDWEALVIDWECSRFTKYASPRTAYQELCDIESDVFPEVYKFIKQNMIPILIRLCLDE